MYTNVILTKQKSHQNFDLLQINIQIMYICMYMYQQFKYINTALFYKLFSIFRTNRKYRSKIIYRIRTCLPFRTRIISTNYHQRWSDDQFEEKALLKGFCDTHRERIPLYIYVLFFTNHYSFKCFFLLCHVLEYLFTCFFCLQNIIKVE